MKLFTSVDREDRMSSNLGCARNNTLYKELSVGLEVSDVRLFDSDPFGPLSLVDFEEGLL